MGKKGKGRKRDGVAEDLILAGKLARRRNDFLAGEMIDAVLEAEAADLSRILTEKIMDAFRYGEEIEVIGKGAAARFMTAYTHAGHGTAFSAAYAAMAVAGLVAKVAPQMRVGTRMVGDLLVPGISGPHGLEADQGHAVLLLQFVQGGREAALRRDLFPSLAEVQSYEGMFRQVEDVIAQAWPGLLRTDHPEASGAAPAAAEGGAGS